MYIKMEWIENTENKHETVDFICEYVSPGNKQIFHLSLYEMIWTVFAVIIYTVCLQWLLVCSNIEYRT